MARLSEAKIKELINKTTQDGKLGEIVYLSYYGSHLYGTNSDVSDIDIKGIYLPHKEDLLMGRYRKSLMVKNNKEEGCKNTKDDVDFKLYSLHYFIELLSMGDINAIDLYFAYTNPSAIIVNHLHDMFKYNPNNFIGLINDNGKMPYMQYIIKQTAKYGIKGTKLACINKLIMKCMEYMEAGKASDRLESHIPELIEVADNEEYVYAKDLKHPSNGEEASLTSLSVIGSISLPTIRIIEFLDRMRKLYDKYGERARLAEMNEGVDWKAVSHAYRCAIQIEMLLEDGIINFPLTEYVEILKELKYGKHNIKFAEKVIDEKVTKINSLLESTTNWTNQRNNEVIRNIILSRYV